MREIKFRGREYDTRYGLRWVYGDLTHKFVQVLVAGCIVEEATVGQFTGLLDSDGKEIYEGDIVKCGTGRICEVVYFLSPVHCGYDLNPVGGFDCKPPSEFTLWSDLKVIGNVHDNPDLLEVEHD